MPKSARIVFIVFFIVATPVIYFFFFFDGKPVKVQFINKTNYDINELAFHYMGYQDTISINRLDSSSVYELNDSKIWVRFFSEPMMGLYVKAYSDSTETIYTDKFGSVVGESSFNKKEVNKVCIYFEELNTEKHFTFRVSN